MSSAAATRSTRGEALARSLTLLRVYLVASAAILCVGAVVLSFILTSTLRHQALVDARSSLTQYVDGVLRPQLVHNDSMHVSRALPSGVAAQLLGRMKLRTTAPTQ